MKTTTLLLLASLTTFAARGEPILISSVPLNLAAGISPTAPIIFKFSEPMNPGATIAQFMDPTAFPPVFLLTSPAWSSANTILTCTPIQALPANKMIVWFLEGENPAGDPLGGDPGGVFTTSGSTPGNCTNEIGSLTLAKGALYVQTSPAAPTPNPTAPYAFVACSSVACSNWSTTNITLDLPNGAATDLPATIIPGHYSLTALALNLTALEGSYPNGNYLFTLEAGAGTLPCPVNFPASLGWPNAPHLTNFAAAQVVNPAQPFQLGWDAFQGGTAQDCIHLDIYGGAFQTPALGAAGALNGLARSATIPAHTLLPNHDYDGSVTFYDLVLTTNANGYISLVYRSAVTEFTLRTVSDAPSLGVIRTATNTVVISWPLPEAGWRLQWCGNLAATPPVWTEIPPPYQNDAASLYRSEPVASGNRFYRLHKP